MSQQVQLLFIQSFLLLPHAAGCSKKYSPYWNSDDIILSRKPC